MIQIFSTPDGLKGPPEVVQEFLADLKTEIQNSLPKNHCTELLAKGHIFRSIELLLQNDH